MFKIIFYLFIVITQLIIISLLAYEKKETASAVFSKLTHFENPFSSSESKKDDDENSLISKKMSKNIFNDIHQNKMLNNKNDVFYHPEPVVNPLTINETPLANKNLNDEIKISQISNKPEIKTEELKQPEIRPENLNPSEIKIEESDKQEIRPENLNMQQNLSSGLIEKDKKKLPDENKEKDDDTEEKDDDSKEKDK